MFKILYYLGRIPTKEHKVPDGVKLFESRCNNVGTNMKDLRFIHTDLHTIRADKKSLHKHVNEIISKKTFSIAGLVLDY